MVTVMHSLAVFESGPPGPSHSASAARKTRSGAQFSPYELDSVKINGQDFGVIRTSISLDSLLREAMIAADERAAAFESQSEEDEWVDEEDVDSKPPSPLSSAPPSPASSTHSSPLSSPPSSPTPTRAASPSPAVESAGSSLQSVGIEKQRRKKAAADRRRVRRQQGAAAGPYARGLSKRSVQAYREQSPHRIQVDAARLTTPTGSAWIGRRSSPARRVITLPELDELDCELVEWNGKDPKLIVDREGRVIAILLGQPDDPDWSTVIKEACKALASARRAAVRLGVWRPGPAHRRGRHFQVGGGASLGGGQRRPGNLRQTRPMRRLFLKLLRNSYIRRIAGFQSAGLALYAPKLYRYYRDVLKGLFQHHPDLVHLFTNSIFPAATFNCGPDAISFDHCDFLNLVHGLCPVTSGGKFNHKLGGHIYLKQLRLVIEFPSGASVAIPSGCVDHGNTPIQPGETRHSITQYAAGGLFRWAAYGYQSAKALAETEEGRAAKAAFDGEPGARWEWAMGLFSKVDELGADRASVFGESSHG
ncbi:hypothetical protein B0H16DRAFT_1741301 [Mycena metata]|uniref:Uncharacterized protein n=1 Tax=Mycena metata TaxID=1033252 RepID=A0AAD7HB70_9AGAR|nr:hypothetical protein B0H16DRAFT_1741301 [Mycena metata]